jgi:hypothetical protein
MLIFGYVIVLVVFVMVCCHAVYADAFPHDCGIGVCAKDGTACGNFVRNAVVSVLNLAVQIVGAVATGGATAIAGALGAAAETAQFFGQTKSCGDSMIHHRSRLAIVTVRDREFQGEHIQVFDNTDWDGCLIRCRHNGNCRGVVSALCRHTFSWLL